MSTIQFAKYQGLGNDFMLLKAEGPTFSVTPEQAARWCDRRLGVGADGVIVIAPASSAQAQAKMVVYNADGSRPEMCGNGFRCVVRWLVDYHRLDNTRPYAIETDAGVKEFSVDESGVAVEMGEATVRDVHINMEDEESGLMAMQVDMGNPHVVLDLPVDNKRAKELGKLIESNSLFPEKTNVEFINGIDGDRVFITVWERGVGLTQACGTGACAVVASLVASGEVTSDTPITVVLPGGELVVTTKNVQQIEKQWQMQVSMRGPAVKVFEGMLDR